MALTKAEYLYGDTMEVKATVRETVQIEPGDLVIINGQANMITQGSLSGASTAADNYAYPWGAGHFKDGAVNNKWFAGIAMDDSLNGSTDTIAIATAGVFRFPLTRKSAVTLGAAVSGATRPGTFSTTSSVSTSWQVITPSSGSTIGYCVKTESGASNIDVMVRTRIGPGGRVS